MVYGISMEHVRTGYPYLVGRLAREMEGAKRIKRVLEKYHLFLAGELGRNGGATPGRHSFVFEVDISSTRRREGA